jgi:hypothetical protein
MQKQRQRRNTEILTLRLALLAQGQNDDVKKRMRTKTKTSEWLRFSKKGVLMITCAPLTQRLAGHRFAGGWSANDRWARKF